MSQAETDVDVVARLTAVHERIAAAAAKHDRDPATIHLVAISKTKPAAMVERALGTGQRDFGENYLQDALAKIEALAKAEPAPRWHFVGDIQSNKTRDIAAHFDWTHAIDRFKIARRLSEQRPAALAPINACIQVNIDDETSKSGVAPDAVEALADRIAELDNVRLRGLMTIPAHTEDFAAQRRPFAALREIRERLNAAGHALDTLSMGMSADLEAAIAEGATHIRIGTAIFGARGQ
ncbi:YggS family pyridoxal phosphate-dependent enzyme [Salinisphaera sp. Q1T1-3]|uniref:YggS family pyridoxal phosphate-dependent enzyme n=1 Tax=Salinisphaera sp. Q1T1-3 TaxID=2321229 RepID=UPI000E71675C|nr:YggS family pyridoxal phosphate-dependent enzyme [Salinisphaera sp. Q1T1-3]RJS94805.1 YggS family pyridoxal phosphate-dependent enzyme [Salinisphaera sp. Q1T1-3]